MPPSAPKDKCYVIPPGPAITAELRRAYLETDYRVGQGGQSFVLRIGEASPRLARLLSEHGMDSAVGITAHNPRSRILGRESNETAHQKLVQRVAVAALRPAVEGMNEGRGGLWPPEKSLLVPGMSLLEGLALAREFDQNAIVYAERDAVPRLAFCRRD